ncbi:hypothetical protein ACOMHN_049182 [Nucella lapillus]
MQISVCDNPIVRANTNLQLPLINNATLRAWFKTRVTCLERQQLTKYLQMLVPAAPSMPIPLARQQPATLDEGQEDIRHEFKLPQNTAGTGKARRKRAAVKIQAAVPIAPLHVHSHVVRAFCPARLSSHTVYAASANSVNDRASCSTDNTTTAINSRHVLHACSFYPTAQGCVQESAQDYGMESSTQ